MTIQLSERESERQLRVDIGCEGNLEKDSVTK